MNEAEKERLIKKDIESVENRVRHAFNQGYEMGMKERQNTCGDAVSRQAVEKITWEEPTFTDALNVLAEVRDKVRALPSVSPQQRTGHWIEKAEDYYKAINEYGGGVDENTDYFTDDIACPKCLSKFSTIDNETERFRHCPKCGAKMESEDEE